MPSKNWKSSLPRACLSGLPHEASRQDGQVITRYWGEIDAIQMLDETGTRSQYVCLFTDITKRKGQNTFENRARIPGSPAG